MDTHACMARKLKEAFDKAIAKMGYTYDQELDYDLSDLSRRFQGHNVFGGGEGGNNSSRDSGGEGTTALSGSGGKPILGTVVGVVDTALWMLRGESGEATPHRARKQSTSNHIASYHIARAHAPPCRRSSP